MHQVRVVEVRYFSPWLREPNAAKIAGSGWFGLGGAGSVGVVATARVAVAEWADLRGATVHAGQRVHLDLRPDADHEPDPRRVLPGGRLRRPDRAGSELVGLAPHEVARLGLGLVPQGRHVFRSLTVVENLTMAARAGQPNGGLGWSLQRVFELFPRLVERQANRAGALSGGEQQMLAIGRSGAAAGPTARPAAPGPQGIASADPAGRAEPRPGAEGGRRGLPAGPR